jgi:hypothetical protein
MQHYVVKFVGDLRPVGGFLHRPFELLTLRPVGGFLHRPFELLTSGNLSNLFKYFPIPFNTLRC